MNLVARDTLAAARVRATQRHPYLSSALFNLRFVEVAGIGTMGVNEKWLCAYDPESVQAIVVRGHADERGSDKYRAGLALQRAQFVADYLVLRGVAHDKIAVQASLERATWVFPPSCKSQGAPARKDPQCVKPGSMTTLTTH